VETFNKKKKTLMTIKKIRFLFIIFDVVLIESKEIYVYVRTTTQHRKNT